MNTGPLNTRAFFPAKISGVNPPGNLKGGGGVRATSRQAGLRRGKQSEGNQLRSTEIRRKSLKSSTENVPYRPPSMPMMLYLLFSCSNPPFYPTFAGEILEKNGPPCL